MLAQLISWLTPGTFFLLLNIVIGTIFLISRFTIAKLPQPGPGSESRYPQPPRDRKPSLLDPVLKSFDPVLKSFDPVLKSFNFDHYKFSDNNYNRYKSTPSYPESEHPNPDEASQSDFWLPTRTRSILERVKSIDFPLFHRSESMKLNPDSEPESYPTREPDRVNRSRSEGAVIQRRIPEMVKKSASENWDQEDEEFVYEPESDPIREPGHVNRSRSEDVVIQRRIPEVIKEAASENWEQEDEEEEFVSESESDPIREPVHVNRSRSEGLAIQRRIPEMIKRSESENWDQEDAEAEEAEEAERNRPATSGIERSDEDGEEWSEEEGDVDLEADQFIDKFRQGLKLQRLKSLLRYKEMVMG